MTDKNTRTFVFLIAKESFFNQASNKEKLIEAFMEKNPLVKYFRFQLNEQSALIIHEDDFEMHKLYDTMEGMATYIGMGIAADALGYEYMKDGVVSALIEETKNPYEVKDKSKWTTL